MKTKALGLIVGLLLACATNVVVAGSGQVVTLPAGAMRNKSGLRLTVDAQWVDASGYRDVRLLLATATGAPSPADRELRIDISPNDYSGSGEFLARQFVTLPQGATQAAVHMLVPQGTPWHQVAIRAYEGGSVWKELSSSANAMNVTEEWSEAIPSFLILDAEAPTTTQRADILTRYNLNPAQFPETRNLVDIRGVETLVKRGMFYPQSEGSQPHDVELLRRLSSTARLEMMPPAAIAENWLGLTCFDFVLISLPDLQAMSANHAPQFRALAAWLRAGGNLVVYDQGANYERLAQLESLLKLTPATRDSDYAAAGWEPAIARNFNDNTTRSFQSMQNYGSYYPETTESQVATPTVTSIESAFGGGDQPRFLTRDVGMGYIVAMATANPYPGSSTEWSWVLNTVSNRRYMWYLRHGLSLRRENNDYWNLLVPNTGMAPVWEFCVLITLFALVIGPVNYFVLFRRKRLYLLLATIPLGAAIVTGGLILYAIASDGLGTRVRIRSYTQLDQHAGHAASWSRQSYYAGLAPSRGLSFPADAAVYVSEQHPRSEYGGGFSRQRTFVWDKEQNLRAGYMSSRVTSQFLVVQSNGTAAAIRFDKDVAPQQAQNGLSGDIEELIVRDRAGNYFSADKTPAGGQMSLEPIKFETARSKLKSRLNLNRPTQPPGLDGAQFNNWYGGWYGGWGVDNSQPPPKSTSSLMEQQLRRLQNVGQETLARGSYIAFVRSSPAVPLGIAGAREEKSFHVIEGKF